MLVDRKMRNTFDLEPKKLGNAPLTNLGCPPTGRRQALHADRICTSRYESTPVNGELRAAEDSVIPGAVIRNELGRGLQIIPDRRAGGKKRVYV